MSAFPLIDTYVQELQESFAQGATEHSYRPALKNLLDGLYRQEKREVLDILNEPKKHAYGAPDFCLKNKDEVSIGVIEAKDLHINLDDFEFRGKNKDQFRRYVEAEANLILTKPTASIALYRHCNELSSWRGLASFSPRPLFRLLHIAHTQVFQF